MPDKTPRFGLDDYEVGESAPWDHSDTVQLLDEMAIDRGPANSRPPQGSYDDELYFATDQQTLYQWDADAGDWLAIGGLGTSLYDLGDTVVLDRTYYSAIEIESTSSEWFEPPEGSEKYGYRAITNYDHFAYDSATNYRIEFGVYHLQRTNSTGSVEIGVGTHGTAPGDNTTPLAGSVISTSGEEFRPTTTFSIDISNFGTWTPALIMRTVNGGEIAVDGMAAFTLLADVSNTQ